MQLIKLANCALFRDLDVENAYFRYGRIVTVVENHFTHLFSRNRLDMKTELLVRRKDTCRVQYIAKLG